MGDRSQSPASIQPSPLHWQPSLTATSFRSVLSLTSTNLLFGLLHPTSASFYVSTISPLIMSKPPQSGFSGFISAASIIILTRPSWSLHWATAASTSACCFFLSTAVSTPVRALPHSCCASWPLFHTFDSLPVTQPFHLGPSHSLTYTFTLQFCSLHSFNCCQGIPTRLCPSQKNKKTKTHQPGHKDT